MNRTLSIFSKALRTGLWSLAAVSLLSTGAFAVPLPGGTLDPLTIPKYVTPLVIPPEMPKSAKQPGFPKADYNIAVRQFKQQILPGGIWNAINGRNDTFGATTIWSYGRAEDPAPDSSGIAGGARGVAPARNSSFNYPAFTVENISGKLTSVRWINDLKDAKGNYLPHLFSIDQTLHWANPAATGCSDGTNHTDCMTMNPAPYTGPVPLVTHVHGSHVNPESDGYPEAWWLPAAKNIPAGYARKGSLFDQYSRFNTVPGSAFYAYENTQPATTLWYHDHALGMTRANVYAGPAGFWLIRGGAHGDAAIDDASTAGANDGKLPGPAPRSGKGDPNFDATARALIREIPIVIQDRSFNADGSLFYPDNRAFFEGLNKPTTVPFLDIPFIGDMMNPSDISSIWNPEAFFNTMVVNGSTWPKLDVAPALYRFRLLNGSNARFLNLSLVALDAGGNSLGEVPLYLIGAEQGFLPQVVRIVTGQQIALTPGASEPPLPAAFPAPGVSPALLMGLAERADVLVDFSRLPAGTVKVRMLNTAPDFPFGGFPIDPGDLSDPDTTGQVMEFVLNAGLVRPGDLLATAPANLVLPAEARLAGPVAQTRKVSLNEEVSGQVCVQTVPDGSVIAIPGIPFDPANPALFETACATAGGEPFGPRAALLGTVNIATGSSVPLRWMAPVTENPILGDTEVWEIFNMTMDGHPIHLHLVRFEVVNRQPLMTDPMTGMVMPMADENAQTTPPQPWETGFKDTVVALPGQVTRIKATFDIPGLYVWHCHILEHEDNEMMRPYVVRVNPAFPDFNNDGMVNVKDLGILLSEVINKPPRNPGYDLNGDGKVDLLDVKYFIKLAKTL